MVIMLHRMGCIGGAGVEEVTSDMKGVGGFLTHLVQPVANGFVRFINFIAKENSFRPDGWLHMAQGELATCFFSNPGSIFQAVEGHNGEIHRTQNSSGVGHHA